MGPKTRKLVLTLHVTSSLGWLGAICAFIALAIAGLTSNDEDLVRGVYLVAEPITWWVIVPMALLSLGSGVIQSLGTTWGLLQHYWVVMKLVITLFAAFVLMLYTQTVDHFADLAADPATTVDQLRTGSFLLHSAVALVLLLGATVLGIYKPRGRTRHGWRKHQERRAAAAA